MKTAAVICEFNPLHRGHAFLLSEMRKRAGEDAVILALMSGDYVQRGEPAVFQKYDRAEKAVESGADLVLELPYPWSCSSGEFFAAGALSLLEGLGAEELYFGSEGKTTEELEEIARRFESAEFGETFASLRREMRNLSYPRLNDLCYERLYGEKPALQPNELLAVCYFRRLLSSGGNMVCAALPMLRAVSASAERERIKASGAPGAAFLENAEKEILAHLSLKNGKDRFSRAANVRSLDELFERARSACDTDARIKRELLSALFDSAGKEKKKPLFTVLLAANARGKAFLNARKKAGGERPVVISRPALGAKDERIAEQFELYLRAGRFRRFFVSPLEADSFLKETPRIVEKS